MIIEAKAAARRKGAFIMMVEQDLMLARFLAGLHSHKVLLSPCNPSFPPILPPSHPPPLSPSLPHCYLPPSLPLSLLFLPPQFISCLAHSLQSLPESGLSQVCATPPWSSVWSDLGECMSVSTQYSEQNVLLPLQAAHLPACVSLSPCRIVKSVWLLL